MPRVTGMTSPDLPVPRGLKRPSWEAFGDRGMGRYAVAVTAGNLSLATLDLCAYGLVFPPLMGDIDWD